MQYADKPEFLDVMRKALAIASKEGLSEDKIIKQAGIELSRTSLDRFKNRKTEQFASLDSRRKLWRVLNDGGFVKAAITDTDKLSDKSKLMSIDEVALASTCFFNTHDSQVQKLANNRIRGLFYGFKNAFRLPNSVTKSIFRIDTPTDDHVIIHEYQRSSGKYDADGRPSEERSEGYGFSKSDKLWFFLREHDFEQPRIFCFSEFKVSPGRPKAKGQKGAEIITSLFGHCLESARKYKDNIYYSKVILTRLLSDDIGEPETFWKKYESTLDLYPKPQNVDYEMENIRHPEKLPISPAILRELSAK